VILDVTMPTMSGLQAAPQIAKLAAGCRILIFTVHESDRIAKNVRAAGANGYVQTLRPEEISSWPLMRYWPGAHFLAAKAGRNLTKAIFRWASPSAGLGAATG
jgi:DNA-binding NarL/FixJ family response regulator